MRLSHTSNTTLSQLQISTDIQQIFQCPVWKYCTKNVEKELKIHGFGEVSSTNCLRQIYSNQKYLMLQNHFQLDNSCAFPKLSFMRAKDGLNHYNSFVYSIQMTECIVLTVQCFYPRRNKGPLVLLSIKFERVAITFYKSQRCREWVS